MRATRAIAGSFGAGISLAIASSLILMIVSSVVAFRGWPDDLSGTSEPTVANLSQQAASSPSSPAGVAAAVSLPPAPSSPASAGKKGRAASPVATGDLALVGSGGGSSSANHVSTADTAGGSSGGGAGSGTPAKTDPGRQVAGVVHQVGDVVAPAAPVVGRTLETIGASGGAVVDQVGQTAGSAVQTVLP